MTPFKRIVRNPKRAFTDGECDDFAKIMAANDDSALMESVPVGAVFWLQFQPTHDSLNSKNVDGVMHNIYSPAADLEGSYAPDGWMYKGAKFALHDSGGLPRFDLGTDNSREIMADNRGNENSFLRRMHLLSCETHNKLVKDYGYSFEKARRATIAITNRITLEFTEMLTGDATNYNKRAVDMLLAQKFHTSLEWNFAAARYAHAMCTATVQGSDPLTPGRYALDIDVRAIFDGSEMAKALTPSVAEPMREMASVAGRPSILKLTLGRSVSLDLPSFGEMAKHMRMEAGVSPYEYSLPIWAGMLYEAERVHKGQMLGPVGASLVYAGNYGHLSENRPSRDGLWFDLDDELPPSGSSDKPAIIQLLDWLEA